MVRSVSKTLLCAASLLLVSCGGGGGGGGGGSSDRGVRILHGAIDLAPADLTSSETPGVVLSSASFGSAAPYTELSSGQQLLTLSVRANQGAGSTSATIVGGEKYSLVLFEGSRGSSFALSLIHDLIPDLESAQSAIRIVHGVHLAGGLDLEINGAAVAGGIAPGEGSAYQVIAAGPAAITVRSAGAVLYSGTLVLGPRAAYTLFVTGESGYFVGARLLQDD